MRQFIFPGGQVWVLDDSQEWSLADLGGGNTGLLVFTDDDLATTYAKDAGLTGKTARAIRQGLELVGLFYVVKRLGVTHLVIDHTAGKPAVTVEIEKALEHAEKQVR